MIGCWWLLQLLYEVCPLIDAYIPKLYGFLLTVIDNCKCFIFLFTFYFQAYYVLTLNYNIEQLVVCLSFLLVNCSTLRCVLTFTLKCWNLKLLAFQDPVSKWHCGIGFVTYENAGSAAWVLKLLYPGFVQVIM